MVAVLENQNTIAAMQWLLYTAAPLHRHRVRSNRTRGLASLFADASHVASLHSDFQFCYPNVPGAKRGEDPFG